MWILVEEGKESHHSATTLGARIWIRNFPWHIIRQMNPLPPHFTIEIGCKASLVWEDSVWVIGILIEQRQKQVYEYIECKIVKWYPRPGIFISMKSLPGDWYSVITPTPKVKLFVKSLGARFLRKWCPSLSPAWGWCTADLNSTV